MDIGEKQTNLLQSQGEMKLQKWNPLKSLTSEKFGEVCLVLARTQDL